MHPIRLVLLALPACALALLLLPSGCNPTDGSDTTGTIAGRTYNNAPEADIAVDVVRGIVPLTVSFDSSGSTDAGGYITARHWDFGDGSTASEIATTHTFTASGEFTVTLTVTDNEGATGTDTVVIHVTQAPVAVLGVDVASAEFAPATFHFDGSHSYDPDGSISAYLWDFDDGAQETDATVQHTFTRAGNYRVRLTVTDDVGVADYAERVIVVGIRRPEISLRVPDDSIANIALTRAAPLWVAARYQVDAGAAYTISAGLDLDRDACDAQAAIYNPTTGVLVNRLLGATQPVRTAVFSPDSSLVLLGGDDGFVRLFDVDNAEQIGSVDTGTGVTALAFSPDGAWFVCGGVTGKVILYDLETLTIVADLVPAPTSPVNSVAYSPNGALVAAGTDDGKATVWATTGSHDSIILPVAVGHAVNSVAFSPTNNNYLATGCADGTAKVWQISTSTVLQNCTGHTNEVTSVVFSADGAKLAAGSLDRSVGVWYVGAGFSTPFQVIEGFDAAITSVVFSPDDAAMVVGCADGSASIRDLDAEVEAESELEHLTPCSSAISSACYDQQGAMVLLGVAAKNGFALNTVDPGGGDLDLDVPTPLDLSSLSEDQEGEQYYLWVEIDTDRTEPVRSYAQATIQILEPATATISGDTPVVTLVDNKAVIVAAANPDVQIFDLGGLDAGDRLKVSLAGMPGYTPMYDRDIYSVLLLDQTENMFAWYQNSVPFWNGSTTPLWVEGRVPMTPSDMLIIGHSANYYLVLQGCTRSICGDEYITPSVSIEVVPEFMATASIPRQQQVRLVFDTAFSNQPVYDKYIEIPAFAAGDINAAWSADTEDIKAAVAARLTTIFADYNVVLSTDTDPLPSQPYIRVTFTGNPGTPKYGWSDFMDPRNQTRAGNAYVFTEAIADEYTGLTAATIGIAMANVAAQQIGLLLGLRNSAALSGDLMDPELVNAEASIKSTLVNFATKPLNSTDQFYAGSAIGSQDAPEYLLEVVGAHP